MYKEICKRRKNAHLLYLLSMPFLVFSLPLLVGDVAFNSLLFRHGRFLEVKSPSLPPSDFPQLRVTPLPTRPLPKSRT